MGNSEIPVIGMSPGNSYFTNEIVKKLIRTVVEKYGRTAVFVADVPAIWTYVALGYPENRAKRDKAIPKGNNLKNKSLKAIQELGYSSEQVKIIDWQSEVADNLDYKQKYAEVSALYNSNSAFAEAADNATQEVLTKANKHVPDFASAVKTAVNYLLEELAFMEFAPTLLFADKVVYIYHKNWAVYESYIAGSFDGKERHYLGFKIISF